MVMMEMIALSNLHFFVLQNQRLVNQDVWIAVGDYKSLKAVVMETAIKPMLGKNVKIYIPVYKKNIYIYVYIYIDIYMDSSRSVRAEPVCKVHCVLWYEFEYIYTCKPCPLIKCIAYHDMSLNQKQYFGVVQLSTQIEDDILKRPK